MRRWSEVADAVGATTKTSEKTAILAAYLASLDADALPVAAVFLTGRPFPEADQRKIGLGWAGISGAVLRVAGADGEALRQAYDRSSDISTAVTDVLADAAHAPDPAGEPTVAEVRSAFEAIEQASGAAAKAALLEALIARSAPRTAGAIVKVLSGELRIGLREGLLEAALARAFDRPLDAVKRAGMLTGDIGRTATLAREGRLGDAALTLFHPLKFMLASPAEDAAEILGRLGPTVWVEDKYDGIRAQLHRAGDEVRLYSRDLHDISGQFPEVIEGARDLPWAGILDGELLAWKDGIVLPFLQLQARLGRKNPSATILSDIPVIYVAWDVLGADRDQDAVVAPLLEEPLAERRRQLEGLHLPLASDGGRFALSHLVSVDSVIGLEAAFAEARARRNEGLMVKDPDSRYSPGRRGLGWLKMKKALATIDCVVVGVEVGHGKRHGVLSDYTFAVRDDASGGLVTIGKAYSGLTDAEIAEMTRWFEAHTISVHGRYRVVEPVVVVEVAFDVIMRSARHKSGFALRFPRIANLRLDKSADEVDTLATVERLYDGLQHGAEHLVTASARR
jgi:DNA ligase-1